MEQLAKDTAIVICSRKSSRRVPNKPFQLVRGKPVLQRLLERAGSVGIPVILAVPTSEAEDYARFQEMPNVILETGPEDDPLSRMHLVAQKHGFSNIIRITHDKIFVDPHMIITALREFKSRKDSHSCMYLYSSTLPAGSGFEIFRYSLLARAAAKFNKVEHICYALKAVLETGESAYDFQAPADYRSRARLLIDYPDDLKLMELIFMECGEIASLRHVITWLDQNRWAYEINRLPDVTVYTCAYNADKYIDACMSSVYQNMEMEFMINSYEENCLIEYIIIDDSSTDATYAKALRFKQGLEQVRVIKNQVNQGLATSSNIALDNARGRYVIRMDADDFFTSGISISNLYENISDRGLDAVYPGFYSGTMQTIEQEPEKTHHVGGAIFNLRSINHIRFTDGLMGFDGLDLYMRARKLLKIGYMHEPTWFYRTVENSMSKSNIDRREQIRSEITSRFQ